MIIGISGKLGSGKDYIANNFIIPKLKKRYLILSFADQLKVEVMTKHNLSFEEVYINKTEESRKKLQYEGTENGRNKFGEDIWIKYVDNWKTLCKSVNVAKHTFKSA